MKNKLLPQKLKELRKANGLNQDYVASELGIVRQTYSHYETGKRTPSAETLFKLAGLYHISVDDLMQLTQPSDDPDFMEESSVSASCHELSDYLDYLNAPGNQKKFKLLNQLEKELLYYFGKISKEDQKEIIEFTKIKAHKP